MTQTEAPEEAQIVLMFLKTRGIFEARFSTPTCPANVPKGMRLHQATRTCTVAGRVTEHEACRQVLLWIWQKFAVTKPNLGPLPDPAAALLGGAQTFQARAMQGMRRRHMPSYGKRITIGADVEGCDESQCRAAASLGPSFVAGQWCF